MRKFRISIDADIEFRLRVKILGTVMTKRSGKDVSCHSIEGALEVEIAKSGQFEIDPQLPTVLEAGDK
jgi:hypothetical protein